METERNYKIECYEEERKKASCDENRLKEELRQLVDTLQKQEVKVNRQNQTLKTKEDEWLMKEKEYKEEIKGYEKDLQQLVGRLNELGEFFE